MKGCYGEALYARDHIGIENIERMNHIDADGKDAIDFILKNGDHIEVKNCQIGWVLTDTSETAELTDGIIEQIDSHVRRYRDKILAHERTMKYIFVQEYEAGLEDRIRELVCSKFNEVQIDDVEVEFLGYVRRPF